MMTIASKLSPTFSVTNSSKAVIVAMTLGRTSGRPTLFLITPRLQNGWQAVSVVSSVTVAV